MKNLTTDFATKQDKPFLISNSKLSGEIFDRKYKYNEILVAKIDNQSVGYLVYDYLWHHIPFISFIWVVSKYRKSGIGKTLLSYLEKFLIKRGNDMLFSSSEENAIKAQEWHRHMGFKDRGSILGIDDNNTSEVFFKKVIK